MMLAERLGGRDNNLNLIRIIAALAVLVSHAFPIAGGVGTREPLEEAVGIPLGGIAVIVFFFISGLLIVRSFDRRPDSARYVAARGLRLMPALIVVLILTVAVLGPLVTTLDLADYARSSGTWTYLPKNLSLAFLQYPLPGVFADNPYPLAINGSLWTLFYEVVCYSAVLALGTLFARWQRWLEPVLLVALVAAFVLWPVLGTSEGLGSRVTAMSLLGAPFALGGAAYRLRDRLPLDLRWFAALVAVALLVQDTLIFPLMFVLTLSYATLWLGYRLRGPVLEYNRFGDYSYGVYIFAFPVQQLVAHAMPGQTWQANIAWSVPAVLALSIASWHLVEARALKAIEPVAQRLSGWTGGASGATLASGRKTR